MYNKRGQFFIIAAVIIIVILASVVTISNYTSTREEVKLIDLGEEISIESQQVIDSGTYSGLDDEQMEVLLENFASNYVTYIQELKNIYFIFGSEEEIHFLGYQELVEEYVSITVFEELNRDISEREFHDLNMGGERNSITVTEGKSITKVILTIGEGDEAFDSPFELAEGENFYFVVWREWDGEKHVVKSDN